MFGTGLALVALFFSGRIGPEHALLSLKLLPVMLLGLSSARWTAPLLDRCWMRPAVLLLFAAVSGLAARYRDSYGRDTIAWALRGFGVALLFVAVVAGGGFVLFGNPTTVEAQSYSAYSDPEKATISFVLSDPQNVAEFKDKFGLSDEEVDKVLAAIHRENQTLSQVQGESQQIIESNEGQSAEQVSAEIEASGYDQKAKRAIARTKAVVKRLLPADQRSEFGAWVDKKWLQASRQASEESATAEGATASASGMWFKVFATQYNGYTNYEVAMPHRSLKLAGNYQVYLSKNGYEAWVRVKEVGPWNTYDNW